MAGYKISSTWRFSRWISSTKRMSFSFKLVSRAARSPAFSMAGPEVTRTFTPISLAMMPDRVVLPRPGGPWSSTWSRGSWRILAAWMNTSRLPLAFSWPIYSRRVLGRREYSFSSSRVREVVTRGSSMSWGSKSELEKSIDIGSLPIGMRSYAVLQHSRFSGRPREISPRYPRWESAKLPAPTR